MDSWRGSSADAQACECVCHNATQLSLPLLPVVLNTVNVLADPRLVPVVHRDLAVHRGSLLLSPVVSSLPHLHATLRPWARAGEHPTSRNSS